MSSPLILTRRHLQLVQLQTNGVADAEFALSSDTGAMNVTQWEQTNVERLWVTVNGLRVPSDRLDLAQIMKLVS